MKIQENDMSEVKRWEPERVPVLDTFNMKPDPRGDFVLHKDYEKLQKGRGKLRSTITAGRVITSVIAMNRKIVCRVISLR